MRDPWMTCLEALCCRGNLTGGFTAVHGPSSILPDAAYLPSYNRVDIQSPPPPP
ncbi:hypothetical protein KY284_012680 [Solanum tuberosum]|nr:hypothetical protein KY284_012680 [Solanum tuberosum]